MGLVTFEGVPIFFIFRQVLEFRWQRNRYFRNKYMKCDDIQIWPQNIAWRIPHGTFFAPPPNMWPFGDITSLNVAKSFFLLLFPAYHLMLHTSKIGIQEEKEIDSQYIVWILVWNF